jgi:hypothetical protein
VRGLRLVAVMLLLLLEMAVARASQRRHLFLVIHIYNNGGMIDQRCSVGMEQEDNSADEKSEELGRVGAAA